MRLPLQEIPMRKNFILAFFICFVATTGFAQSGFSGKWATDRITGPVPLGERREIVQLEVAIENGRASGTVARGGLGGTFDTFKDGKITGNKLQFRTGVVNREGIAATTNWQLELVDENTVTITSEGPNLPIVTTNVLDLIGRLPGAAQVPPPVQIPANTQPSPLKGKVQDPSGALIPGVTVTATNTATGASFKTITGDTGQYSFPGITPGKYSLSAFLPGFEIKTVPELAVSNTQTELDLTLEIGMMYPPTFNRPPLATLHRVK
jgi:hypothetical protein